jgi:hypothetical protein
MAHIEPHVEKRNVQAPSPRAAALTENARTALAAIRPVEATVSALRAGRRAADAKERAENAAREELAVSWRRLRRADMLLR